MTTEEHPENGVEQEDCDNSEELVEELGWQDLGLGKTSLEAVGRMGYQTPSEVQQQAIPRVSAGADLIVQAKTGSGKTLAFGLPILEKLDRKKKEVQALVLSPTRELAMQVSQEITAAGELGNSAVVPVFGGASMNAQIQRIRGGAQVVVGTPGRILDHLRRGTLSLAKAWMVVLDEADEMLDRGFLPDVMRILDHTAKEKQTMLFSATIPIQIKNMAKRYLQEPETIIIGDAGLSINYDIHHSYYRTPKLHKFITLVNVLYSIPRTKVLIFCNMKSDTENVAECLHEEGFMVGFLSGDLSQAIRTKTLDMFKEGVIDVLVATDVAARGIDIEGISHVINYELPENKELYLHRTGRTGRAGRKGEAISIVSPADILIMGTIERTMKQKFDELQVPGKEEVMESQKEIFIKRLHQMAEDGHPDDLSLLTDDLLEDLEPYEVTAGLLVLLRQRGWELKRGYDPDQPEHKDQMFVRPALLGKQDLMRRDRRDGGGRPQGRRDSRPDRNRGGRDHRGGRNGGNGRSERSEKGGSNRNSARPERKAPVEMVRLSISLGSESGLEKAGDLLSLVTQTGGVKKNAIGKIEIGETSSRFELNVDMVDKMIQSFDNRKKNPMAKVESD